MSAANTDRGKRHAMPTCEAGSSHQFLIWTFRIHSMRADILSVLPACLRCDKAGSHRVPPLRLTPASTHAGRRATEHRHDAGRMLTLLSHGEVGGLYDSIS